MPKSFIPPTECPVCGEDVPRNAKACPKCGACENSGWKQDDEDEDTFDYESFIAEEFGAGRRGRSAKEWFWRAMAVLVLIGLALTLLVRIF